MTTEELFPKNLEEVAALMGAREDWAQFRVSHARKDADAEIR